MSAEMESKLWKRIKQLEGALKLISITAGEHAADCKYKFCPLGECPTCNPLAEVVKITEVAMK